VVPTTVADRFFFLRSLTFLSVSDDSAVVDSVESSSCAISSSTSDVGVSRTLDLELFVEVAGDDDEDDAAELDDFLIFLTRTGTTVSSVGVGDTATSSDSVGAGSGASRSSEALLGRLFRAAVVVVVVDACSGATVVLAC
jgi:hypothetical protein